MNLHRIPRKQLDSNIFYVNDDMDRIVGLDRTTVQVHDHLHDVGAQQGYHKGSNVSFDPTLSALSEAEVQAAVTEFANKPIATPVQETSALIVTTDYYQVTSSIDAYVGTTPGVDPNSLFALYDVDGIELPITVLDVTSDQAGTTSVLGQTWHNKPYLQLSAVPNEQILVKYGVESTLASLPIDALLKEGVISAEIDSEVIAAIADIKGTAWDVPVPAQRNLVGLDTRMTAVEGLAHVHKIGVDAVGTMDGVNASFTTPDNYVLGTLQITLSGTRLHPAMFTEDSANAFTLVLQPEQLPNAAVQDWMICDYILG